MEQKLAYEKLLLSKVVLFLVTLFKSPTKHVLSDSKILFCFLPAPASLMSIFSSNTSQYFGINHNPFKKKAHIHTSRQLTSTSELTNCTEYIFSVF